MVVKPEKALMLRQLILLMDQAGCKRCGEGGCLLKRVVANGVSGTYRRGGEGGIRTPGTWLTQAQVISNHSHSTTLPPLHSVDTASQKSQSGKLYDSIGRGKVFSPLDF